MTFPDRAVAIHEAGHALAHHLFGIPIALMSIVPGEGTAGRCMTAPKAVEQLAAIIDGTHSETDPNDRVRIIDAYAVC